MTMAAILGMLSVSGVLGCAGPAIPALKPLGRPIDLPFVSEAEAHNGVESYPLTGDGEIATTYTFRDGGFDGPERVMTPTARVFDRTTNTHWNMQFLWPFEADYLVVYVDGDYRHSTIGVPDRKNVWVMARRPDIPPSHYDELAARVEALGYQLSKLRRVPQRWPAGAAAHVDD